MTSPWDVLGVARGSSQQEVRKAYASLLKQHRPDVDPAGFRRIRDAYELLRDGQGLFEVFFPSDIRPRGEHAANDHEHRAEVASETVARGNHQPARETALRGVRPRPLPLAPRIRRGLLRARAAGHHDSELRILRILVNSWRSGGPLAHEVDLLLSEELLLSPGPVRTEMTPKDVLRALDRRNVSLATQLLHAHVAADDWGALRLALLAIEGVCTRDPTDFTASMLVSSAKLIAFIDVGRAEALANVAFPGLASASRWLVEELELWIQAGRQVQWFSLEERSLLTRVMVDARVGHDAPEVTRALEVLAAHAPAPTLVHLLARRFPTLQGLIVDAGAVARQPRPEPDRKLTPWVSVPRPSERRLWMPSWLLVVIAVNLALIPSRCANASLRRPPSTQIPRPARVQREDWLPGRFDQPAMGPQLRQIGVGGAGASPPLGPAAPGVAPEGRAGGGR